MDRKAIGFIGSGLLAIGLFRPIVSLPIVGNMTYIDNGRCDGIDVGALAAIAAGLLLTDRLKVVIYVGTAAALVLAYTFINFQVRLSQMKDEMEAKLAGNPFGGLAEMAMQSVQLQWGWVVLVAGAGCVIAAGLKRGQA